MVPKGAWAPMGSRASTLAPEGSMPWTVGGQEPDTCAGIKAEKTEHHELGLLCEPMSGSRVSTVPSLQFQAENAGESMLTFGLFRSI